MVKKKTRRRLRREAGLVAGTAVGSIALGALPASTTQAQGQQFFTGLSSQFGTLGTIEGAALNVSAVRQLSNIRKKRRKRR